MKCPSCGVANIEGADACESCHQELSAPAARGLERRILEGTVSALSPKPALIVAPGDALAQALGVMRRAKVGCLLVVEDGRLEGVLSEREILFNTGERTDWDGTPVSALMRAAPAALRREDSVADAFHQMAVSGHRHLPVALDPGRWAVVSARDLLRYLCK